jgi:hypothetical protein
MIHPNTELRYINNTVGYGVFATKLIPEGTISYVKDSLEIVVKPDEYDKHPAEVQQLIEKYSYMDQEGDRIISWDFAKYVNHCCNCNTISTGYGFEIAIRDIHPGEQLTDEYGIFNLDEDFSLICDQPHCRKRVSPTDLDVYHAVWDERIKRAFAKFQQVEQPLLSLVDSATRAELDAYLHDPTQYKSVYALRLKHARVTMSSNGQAEYAPKKA